MAAEGALGFYLDFYSRVAQGEDPARAAWQAQRSAWCRLAVQDKAEALLRCGYFRLLRSR